MHVVASLLRPYQSLDRQIERHLRICRFDNPEPCRCHDRNLVSASIVSLGRSSISQCPVSLSPTTLTSFATSFICGNRVLALAFSPAIARTGRVSFVFDSSAKSFEVCGHAAK